MATQRYISTSFWDDAWIRKRDPSERYVYLYLLTNPLTNIAGVYKTTIDRISFDTGYEPKIVETVFKRFSADGKAYFYKDYVILPSWPKHQKVDKREKIKTGIEAILRELPPEILKYLKKIGYRYPIDTISIPYGYDSNYLDSDSDSDSDSEFDSEFDLERGAHKAPPSDNPEPEKPAAPRSPSPKRFVKPSLEEIKAYCAERKNTVSPEKFLDYYEANGWRVGRNPMKDWRAAVRNWEQNEKAGGKNASRPSGRKDPWDEPGYYENGGMREARGL